MTTSQADPDPVSDAAGYQQMLLAALGHDDPAVAASETPANIRSLLAGSGEHLRTRPEPREWSALLCLAHIVDAEIVMSGRYRWVLAHDEPELIGYDQELIRRIETASGIPPRPSSLSVEVRARRIWRFERR